MDCVSVTGTFRPQRTWDALDFERCLTVEWEGVPEDNKGECKNICCANSPTDSSFEFGTPTPSSFGFGSSTPSRDEAPCFMVGSPIGGGESYICSTDCSADSVSVPPRQDVLNTTVTLTAEKNRTFALPVGDTVTESYICPTDWSQDTVFVSPRKIVVNATMIVSAGKNRTFDITPVKSGADLTGVKDSHTVSNICPNDCSSASEYLPTSVENGTVVIAANTTRVVGETSSAEDCTDFSSGSLSWDYPNILSFERDSMRDQPLCSTPVPLPQDSDEQASVGGEECGASYSPWFIWVPLACLAVAGAGFCAVKFCR